MKAAIDYKEANSALIGVDTFEGILGYIVATVISNKNIQAHERSFREIRYIFYIFAFTLAGKIRVFT